MRNINDKPLVPIIFNMEEVEDYIKCPNYFYMKYLTKIPTINNPTFKKLVQTIIDAYLARLLNGKILSMLEAKRKWDKLAEQYPEVLTPKKIIEGIGIFNKFNDYCHANRVIIADMNSEYQMNFKDNIVVKGKIGALRYYDKDNLELFIVETSQKIPDKTLIDMSLRYTMQLYAINKLTGSRVKVNGLRIYHVKSGKEITSYRTQKDFIRLEKTIEAVAKAVRNKIFYPHEDYLCHQCSYKNYCGYL